MPTRRLGAAIPRCSPIPQNTSTAGSPQGSIEGQWRRACAHLSFFEFERTWWEARRRPNVLLVHYNDLKADLAEEMARVASFLGIDVPQDRLAELAAAAGFDAMRRDGDVLMASAAGMFRDRSRTFIHKGINGRWRGVVNADDLALYAKKAEAILPPGCLRWLEEGRRGGDPGRT